MMPETMRAVRLTALEGPAALEVADVPVPKAGPQDVLIEVHAAGVGFADLLMTRGRYQFRPEPPFLPGVEIAGVVVQAPADSGLAPGDRVAASSRMGAWAEYAISAPPVTYRIAERMSFVEATVMVNYQTAYWALAERGHAKAGETLLVHGAAGGTGTAAIDVGAALGMTVIAVARGDDKRDVAAKLGAHHTVDADGEWLAEVRRITGDRGVDVVFDPVGGDRFLDSVRSLAIDGRLLVIGFAGGTIPEVKVNRLLLRNTSVVGAAWAEYLRHDVAMPRRVAAELARLHDAGKLHPLIGSTYPLQRAADALREIEERRAMGKIALVVRT
jgi:NADPH2:quinone reductase